MVVEPDGGPSFPAADPTISTSFSPESDAAFFGAYAPVWKTRSTLILGWRMKEMMWQRMDAQINATTMGQNLVLNVILSAVAINANIVHNPNPRPVMRRPEPAANNSEFERVIQETRVEIPEIDMESPNPIKIPIGAICFHASDLLVHLVYGNSRIKITETNWRQRPVMAEIRAALGVLRKVFKINAPTRSDPATIATNNGTYCKPMVSLTPPLDENAETVKENGAYAVKNAITNNKIAGSFNVCHDIQRVCFKICNAGGC